MQTGPLMLKMMRDLFVPWIYCIDREAGNFQLSRVVLGRLYSCWKEGVRASWAPLDPEDVSEQTLGS